MSGVEKVGARTLAVIAQEITALAPTEAARLDQLEATIERGLQTFVEVGLALTAIRDERLYRAEHGTFERYCADKWGFSDRRARQLMDTAQIGTMVPVANERQARELLPLVEDEDELRDVWAELRERHGDNLTAAKARDAVDARMEREQVVSNVAASNSFEWYTLARYIEAAREVLGGIDLDPSSSEIANKTVRANRFFTAVDDGLTQDWPGRVWMNPPYGRLAPRFVAHLLEQHARGIATSAVVLVSAYSTDTAWFQPLFDFPICFVAGRIGFDSPTEQSSTPPFASAFAYLGSDEAKFARVFSDFGPVVVRRPEQPTGEWTPSEVSAS